MYSLDLIILIKCRNDSIVCFALLHLCLKTENLAFNKKQFSTFVFAFIANYIAFEMMTQPGAYVIPKL